MTADVLVLTDKGVELDARAKAIGQALEERYRAPVTQFTFSDGQEERTAITVGVEGVASVGVTGVTRRQLDSAQWSEHGRVDVDKVNYESRYDLSGEVLNTLLADVPGLADKLDGVDVHLAAEGSDSIGWVPVARFSEGTVERTFIPPDSPATVIPVVIVS